MLHRGFPIGFYKGLQCGVWGFRAGRRKGQDSGLAALVSSADDFKRRGCRASLGAWGPKPLSPKALHFLRTSKPSAPVILNPRKLKLRKNPKLGSL